MTHTKEYCAEYRKKNKKKINDYHNTWKRNDHKLHPEKYILDDIKQRCNNPRAFVYKWYGGKGVKCRITIQEILYLMKRDNYWGLKRPSIDRVDSNGDYTLDNCQFIEHSINAGKDKRKIVIQKDLEGNFIREFPSTIEAGRQLKINHTSIIRACNGHLKTAYKFCWEYKNVDS